jgi:hypothetical protein
VVKKSAIVLVLALLGAGAALFLLSQPVPLLGYQDASFLRDRTVDFLEDLKFKDFAKASTYHLPETQQARDIPELIRRVFAVKHELLDIQRWEILGVEFDRKENRSRVRALVFYRLLGDKVVRDNANNQREVEMLFYWFKQKDGSWAMELESSLR